MNVPTSNRTLSNTPTSYEKLTLKLTPLAPNHNGIIRISAKGTPTTNSDFSNSTLYNRITRHQFNNQSLPSKAVMTSPGTSLPKDSTVISGRLIRSEVTTSTRNWEAECGVLKQSLDYYKTRTLELQNKQNNHPLNEDGNKIEQQSMIFKQRLEETQTRMNQQNAYLRECMTKLNDQLQQTKQTIPRLQNNLTKLEESNTSLSEELKHKTLLLNESQTGYQTLIQQAQDQKSRGESVNQKLIDLQRHIESLEQQNIKANRQLVEAKRIKHDLQAIVQEEKFKHQSILNDCLTMQKQISSHKQHINQLQDAVSKLREDNESLKKSMNEEPQRNLFLTKSVCHINKSLEFETGKLNSSYVGSYSKSSTNQKLPLRRSYSTTTIQEKIRPEQFSIKVFDEKAQEFRLIKNYMNMQHESVSQSVSSVLSLGQYFKDSISLLVADKTKLQSSIEKYKRLVEISWQNPNIQQQSKSEQFITDLIQKCNLYESSLYEKKNTIDFLHRELQELKKQTRNTSRTQKPRFKYLDREDELQKQKIIITKLQKQVDHLNMKLTQPPSRGSIVNSSMSSINILDKIKSFKVVGSSLKKDHNSHSKLKNISGEEILKQMQTKLKFYEGQVVPGLQAKVSQYKGMLDSFEREYTNKNQGNQSLIQSRVTNITRVSADSDLKRRKHINTGFDDFRDSILKHSEITKPETTDSSISKQKKKRLDQLSRDVSVKVLAAITLRLCEIAQRMVKNQNYALILPDSIYLINYSDQYVGSLKIKILETPRDRENDIKKYWAPENLQGAPLGELSLVWNLGVLLDQTIHGKLFFDSQQEITDAKIIYKFIGSDNPFFKNLLEKMLQKDRTKRILLKQIQTQVLQEQQSLFN